MASGLDFVTWPGLAWAFFVNEEGDGVQVGGRRAREICKREISLRERVRVGESESESGREQGARPVGEWQLAVGER
jgi:hypothetical protein